MRRSYLFTALALLSLFGTSYSANQVPFCRDLFVSHEVLSVRRHIEKRIEELGGEQNFSKTYQPAQGLLQLAQELSSITDDIDQILEVVLSVLGEDSFVDFD